MATNKHATIRYLALDRCFSNFGKRFFIQDLIDACNQALYDYSGILEGVKRRQIFDDITYMESSAGWEIPLERYKDGRKVYYRYTDRSFTIKNLGMNQTEAEQLKEALTVLARFKGLPQFEWIEEMQVRLEDTFKLKGNNTSLVGFEQNPYLKGLSHFTGLFNAIQNEVALLVTYQGFKQNSPSKVILHPWYLKQFNNRWFLFGLNEELKTITNFALDRIIEFEDSKVSYSKNRDVNFEEYFEDVIGVTVKRDAPTEKILIKVNKEIWPYIESKPIHGSQKVKNKDETTVLIELTLQVNHELHALLFSYMNQIEILEPVTLRQSIQQISNSINEKYN
jgi:predicted DNA-binding transcriptional regulator YafY